VAAVQAAIPVARLLKNGRVVGPRRGWPANICLHPLYAARAPVQAPTARPAVTLLRSLGNPLTVARIAAVRHNHAQFASSQNSDAPLAVGSPSRFCSEIFPDFPRTSCYASSPNSRRVISERMRCRSRSPAASPPALAATITTTRMTCVCAASRYGSRWSAGHESIRACGRG